MDEPITMTRAEYEATYGAAPVVQDAPISMTRAEYEQTYGVPAPSPGRTFAESLGNIGQSFARGVEGLGQINPFSPYAMSQIGTDLTRATGLEPGPSMGELLTQARKDAIGEPDYQGAGPIERYMGAGAEMLPYAALGGGPGAAFTSGVGGEVSKDLGFDPLWGQLFGGGVYEGVKRGGSTLLNMLTGRGREREAGKILGAAVGDEGIRNLRNLGPASSGLTMAEVAQTPGAANLQIQLGKEVGPGNIIRQVLDDRAGARAAELKTLAPGALEGVTPDIRGDLIRDAAAPVRAEADELVSAAWRAAGDAGGEIDLTKAGKSIVSEMRGMETPLGFSKDAQKVVAAIVGAPDGVIPVEQWPKIRQAAGEVMGQAAASGANTEARLMAIVREQLDTAADSAAKAVTVDPQKLALIRSAIDTTRKTQSIHASGVAGDITKKGDYGVFKLSPSSIPRKVISTPESAKQFAAAYSDLPELMTQGRAALVDDMARKQPDTWVKYFTEKQPQFKALFGEDFAQAERVFKDLASEQGVQQLAQKATGRQSITAQGQTVMNYLLDSTRVLRGVKNAGSVIGAGVGGASGDAATGVLGAVIGEGVSRLAGYAERDIRMALARAVVEPGFAAKLLAKPSASLAQEVAEVVLPILGASAAEPYSQNQSAAPRKSGSSLEAPASNRKSPETKSPNQIERPKVLSSDKPAPISAPTQPKSAKPKEPAVSLTKNIDQIALKNDLSDEGKAKITKALAGTESKEFQLLARAVIAQESSGKPGAVGKVVNVGHGAENAQGLMQVLPSTAKDIAKELGIKKYNLKDPTTNKIFGEYYLMKLLRQFDGDPELALAAYHSGPGRVENLMKITGTRDFQGIRHRLGPVGKKYPREVMARLEKLATAKT